MPKECSYPGCTRAAFAAGLCRGHFAQKQRGQALAPLRHQGPGRGHGLQVVKLRLRPETIAALGANVSGAARQILELCTGTGDPLEP